jgi:hypothetical protein
MEVDMTRTLSVRQPWAWAIFNGKNIENRSWKLEKGLLLIHASKTFQRDEWEADVAFCYCNGLRVPPRSEMVFGAVIGAVDVAKSEYSLTGDGRWGIPKHYHTHLENQRLFRVPIPCKGSVGLFLVDLMDIQLQEVSN